MHSSLKIESPIISFIFLILFIAPMFFFRENFDYTMLFLSFVFCLVPIKIFRNSAASINEQYIPSICFSFPIINIIRSPLFVIIFSYSLFISFRTCANDGFALTAIQENIFLQFLPLILYIIVIAQLSNSYPDFEMQFFSIITFFASINAAFNLIYYFYLVQNVQDPCSILCTRLGFDSIGIATGNTSTTFSLTYALFAFSAFFISDRTHFLPAKFFYIYLAITVLLALILTQSRGPNIALIISILAYIHIEKNYTGSRRRIVIAFVASLLLSILIYYFYAGRLMSDGYRMSIFSQSLTLFLQNRYFGSGENDFYVLIPATSEIMYHGHNILINSALRGGIVGLLLMISFLIRSLSKAYQLKKTSSNLLPFYLLIIIIISGMVDFDIIIRNKGWDWVSIWTIFGLAIAAERKLKPNLT